MTKQHYFPKTPDKRPGWLSHFALQLPELASQLELPADAVAAAANDAAFLAYVLGPWTDAARKAGPAATAAGVTLCNRPGTEPFELPVFTPPPLPELVTPVPPGALQRVFAFVQTIKTAGGYTESIGHQLGIIGAEDATEHPLPAFTLRIERGDAGERVRVRFFRYDRPGVIVHSRRGDGAWEQLVISLQSPWTDPRALLIPTQPEVREYRLQFFAGSSPASDFTPVQTITVAP